MHPRPARDAAAQAGVPLPSSRAFLVQFAGGTPGPEGRAEHLASGQAIHFDSWALLQEFVESQLEREPS